MTNDERRKYQQFAVEKIKSKVPVRHGKGRYRVKALIYRLSPTGEKIFTAELHDVNGCDSLITVGIENLFEENNNEVLSE